MKYYIINLRGKVVESSNIYEKMPFLEKDTDFALDRFFILKEKLINRQKTRRILIRMHSDFQAYPGQLEEIYRYLQDLKDAGKEMYFYAKTYNLKELYLASLCQHRIIPADGSIIHYGLSLGNIYLKNLLDKLNIQADVYRRGKYKGAADTFRVSSMDDAQKEANSLLLKRIAEVMENTIRENISIDLDFIQELKAGTFYKADEAIAKGIVTQNDYWYNLVKSWEDEKLKKDQVVVKKMYTGKGYKIAVLSFEGNIVDGSNKKIPLMGNSCGDDFYVDEISQLAKNKAVKAVVFKVNSGGGSASASAEIANALEKLQDKKPLVVVQSGIAGSGGYYISFPAEKIFTQYSTITGSIGVIYLLFFAKHFMEKYGITRSTIKDGEHADLLSSWRERDDEEKAMIMNQIDYIYDTFTAKVAKNRNMDQEEVNKIGQGRVWSGYDAVEAKICDDLGGLGNALAYLKDKLAMDSVKLEFFPKPKRNLLKTLLGSGRAEGMAILEQLNLLGAIKEFNSKPLCYTEELLMLNFRL